MKAIAIAAGALVAAAAIPVSAQVYLGPAAVEECWNPRAGHFERVRPGEYQDDLDFRRCRVWRERWVEPAWRERPVWRDIQEECWNPRAGHYEEVRPGEFQGDLDYGRCRLAGERVIYGRNWLR